MKNQRCVWTFLAAAILLVSLGAPYARAQRAFVVPGYTYPSGPFLGGGLTMPSTFYFTYPAAQTYNPYVAPYPAYGILPPPFATARYYESWTTPPNATTGKTAADYGYRIESQPRMRSSLYPAVPFERSPEERQADLRRVRYEISVPYANAEVFMDGVRTKQTGLHRVFVTPPVEEDRYYTSTIKVQWVDSFNEMRTREKTFSFVAGETIRHQFKE
jgi:uncharacterized protein (TIGR03000 family)